MTTREQLRIPDWSEDLPAIRLHAGTPRSPLRRAASNRLLPWMIRVDLRIEYEGGTTKTVRPPNRRDVQIDCAAADLTTLIQSLDAPMILIASGLGTLVLQHCVLAHPHLMRDRIAATAIFLHPTAQTVPLHALRWTTTVARTSRPATRPHGTGGHRADSRIDPSQRPCCSTAERESTSRIGDGE